MRLRFLVPLLAAQTSLWLAGCGTPPAGTGAKTDQSARVTEIKGLFPKLAKGMSGVVVREKLGPPAEIKPMASPNGRAEVWVYHFETSEGSTQIATGVADVPTYGVGTSGPGTVPGQQLTFSSAEKKSLVTLSLLMFNNHLAAQKAAVEHVLDYH